MYKHILIPTDGSPTADKAVEAGLQFAREAGARDAGVACDAIFISSHARTGLAKRLHGSETEDVLTGSAIPTLVYR